MVRGSAVAALCALSLVPWACHLVSGVGDLEFVEPVTGTGGGVGGGTLTSSTTSLSTSTTSSATSSSSSGGGGGVGGSGGTGGGGQGGTGGAATDCLIDLQDDFPGTELNYTLWGEWGQSAEWGVDGGRLFIEPWANTAQAWADVESSASFDLRECGVLVQLNRVLNNEGEATTVFSIRSGGWQDAASFQVVGGELVARVTAGGSPVSSSVVTYDGPQHRWLRLRGAAGTLYFETAPNGATWTERHQAAAPSWLDAATITLGAGTWDAGTATPGRAEFDKVNLPP